VERSVAGVGASYPRHLNSAGLIVGGRTGWPILLWFLLLLRMMAFNSFLELENNGSAI
jgi:hypothetical protein